MWRSDDEMLTRALARGRSIRRWRRIIGGAAALTSAVILALLAVAIPNGGGHRPTTLHIVGPPTTSARPMPSSTRSRTPATLPVGSALPVGSVGLEVTQLVPVGPTSAWAMANLRGDQDAPAVFKITQVGLPTWSNVTPGPISSAGASLFALNANQAWLTVNPPASTPTRPVTLLATSDGGRHWKAAGAMPVPCQVDFVSTSDGWCPEIEAAAGSEAVNLYRTTDGGRHWELVSTSASPTDPRAASATVLPFGCDKSFSFQSPTLGWVSFSCGDGAVEAYRSTDAGAEWSPVTFSPQPPPSGEATIISSPVVTGRHGAMAADIAGATVFYRTSNAGRAWQPVHPPTRARTWTPDIIDPLDWVLAGDHQVATTADGGKTWAFTDSDTPLAGGAQVHLPYAVTFTSPSTGWAVARGYTTILYTTTAGRHWTRVPIPD
jgi:photosystem II stability/assembly factor-like uncharacterized protein